MIRLLTMTIGAMVLTVGLYATGTLAVFIDTETSSGNTLVAGALDMNIDQAFESFHPTDGVIDGRPFSADTPLGSGGSPEVQGPIGPFVIGPDVLPNSYGGAMFSFHNISTLEGELDVTFGPVTDDDVSCAEPEGVAEGDNTCGLPDDGTKGELSTQVSIHVYHDKTCDNSFGAGDTTLHGSDNGSGVNIPTIGGGRLADLPLTFVGLMTLVADDADPFTFVDKTCVAINWIVEDLVGTDNNKIMTDKAVFDVTGTIHTP